MSQDSAPAAAHVGAPFPPAGAPRWPRVDPRVVAVVFVGGIGGGLARYGVGRAWPAPAYAFPWSTFVVNTSGAFALALLLVLAAEVLPPHRYLRPLLGTGVLGAFTTFSSVVTGTDDLAGHGHAGLAAAYVLGSAAAGLAAAAAGLLLGRTIAVRRRERGG